MRRLASLLPVLVSLVGVLPGCPLPPHPPTPVQPKLKKEPTTNRSYWLYLPSYHTKERQWPLVISLHGTYGWDGAWAQVMEWKHVAENHGFIVAAPRLCSVQGILPTIDALWMHDLDKDEELILAVIDDVCKKYNADPKAVMMTGFSAGGYPLYHVGLRNCERFNMLIARACNSSHKIFERLDVSEADKKLPVTVFWGKDDLGTIHEESWQAFRWLREHGFKQAERKRVEGGHLRRPELAYRYWLRALPRKYRSPRRGN